MRINEAEGRGARMSVGTKHGRHKWVDFKCRSCGCASSNCPECGRPCHTVMEENIDD